MDRRRSKSIAATLIPVALAGLASCVSHLREAKFFYARGQEYSRRYDQPRANAAFLRARQEAEKAVGKEPGSQAFMVRGLAEMSLEMWDEAEQSFRTAFAYGFENGQEWAEWLSLFGLAVSLQESGLGDSARRLYLLLIDRSRLKPVTVLAAQRYTEAVLEEALAAEGREKDAAVQKLLKELEDLSDKDPGCGYYHYLISQALSHRAEYGRAFEEAVMAKELGLPSHEVSRDNDLQIVFCARRHGDALSGGEREEFQAVLEGWIKRWGWPDPSTPEWRKR